MTRIGLAYVSGAVPGFEDFGNLPTDIVKENGLEKEIKKINYVLYILILNIVNKN